jgi:hypothetical protein|tara:strand:+ start:8930 stop:9385 length:456 start_codon:yes stop_codon:yes gene_type:complete
MIFLSTITFSQNIGNADAVENVLDNLHLYAAEAKAKKYMALFSEDAVFFGTDISERWAKQAFDEYATKRMATGTGWTYFMKERHIYFSDDGRTAWFDEILHNRGYGDFRGTGVLKMVGSEWKIAQYNLLLPIPNDLMMKYAKEIKVFYGQK